MTSDLTPMGGFPTLRRWLTRGEERKAWEAANPEIAAAWREAMLDDEAWVLQRAAAEQLKRMERDAVHQLRKLGVPERAAATLERPDLERPGFRAVRAWLQAWRVRVDGKPKPFLLLLGETGTGKTTAAAYAALAILVAHHPGPSGGTARDAVMWAHAMELSVLSSFGEADRAWFERLKHCGLLVLDDLGTEAIHEHAQQRLDRLVDERYGNSRWTVITTNASPDVFKQRVGARIADRIREAGRVVNCGNQSLRGVT